ncbi:uncharacterized protein LOC111795141 [Cucurbita pepo subsp. pepo]|uniref:uncharacterized protein LOC111795141 n=1 Tax=Cucurbita pepo subsp. pepo TaxID=3664 RepID=UPI000C9D5CEA|nr:uncharacterized protein LOC111795141 [Cucurbita pepo subsp. pepo]
MGGSSNCHARSNSLPTRPHPLVTECDEHLCRLKALDSAPWTAPAMVKKLAGLQDLQECVNKLLLLRRTMDAFAAQRREKWVDEIFDGSLRLLDLCSAAKDGVIHTKECVRELQSLVRRRSSFSGSCGNAVANQVEKYLISRKVVIRAIQKSLASIKTYGTKSSSISIKDTETMALIALLFDVEATSVNVVEALMCYVLGKKGKAKSNGWALVSKLMRSKKGSLREGVEEGEENEFATVDAAVDMVASRLPFDNVVAVRDGIESMGDQLGKLEACVQDLEGGLEGLFRRLIGNRVLLLNIINN